MRSVIAAVALAALALVTGANGQTAPTQPPSQGTQTSTSGQTQTAPGATDADAGFFGRLRNSLGLAGSSGSGSGNVQSTRQLEKQDPDLAYQACYLRCIATGNPADFCESKSGGFCPK